MNKMSLLFALLSVYAVHAADETEGKEEELPAKETAELSRKFDMIMRKGTLQEFTQKLYPVFKTQLSADCLETYLRDCECHLNAIQYIERMHTDPFIEIVVLAMKAEAGDRAGRDYLARKKMLKNTLGVYVTHDQTDTFMADFQKTTDMAEAVIIGSSTGASIRIILGKLPMLNEVEKVEYFQNEKEKAEAIKVAIKDILDTEFEPNRTLLQLGNLYQSVKLRKQKPTNI